MAGPAAGRVRLVFAGGRPRSALVGLRGAHRRRAPPRRVTPARAAGVDPARQGRGAPAIGLHPLSHGGAVRRRRSGLRRHHGGARPSRRRGQRSRPRCRHRLAVRGCRRCLPPLLARPGPTSRGVRPDAPVDPLGNRRRPPSPGPARHRRRLPLHGPAGRDAPAPRRGSGPGWRRLDVRRLRTPPSWTGASAYSPAGFLGTPDLRHAPTAGGRPVRVGPTGHLGPLRSDDHRGRLPGAPRHRRLRQSLGDFLRWGRR
jgi:hypothetical protein